MLPVTADGATDASQPLFRGQLIQTQGKEINRKSRKNRSPSHTQLS
jgi:hypothetical protein